MKIRIPTDSLGGIFLAMCFVSVFVGAVYGWGWNIAKIFQADTLTGMVLARVIGAAMFPVGAVMGYF